MRAGRDLDLIVIEKVMGWKYDPARKFAPSTEVGHAWAMEEYLLTAGEELSGAYGRALYALALPAGEKLDEAQIAGALAHASPELRCRAALRAVGVSEAAAEPEARATA